MFRSHIKDDFLKLLLDNNQNYCLIPGGLTHVLQHLDVSINKLLKQRITQIYCDICIKLGRIIEKIKEKL